MPFVALNKNTKERINILRIKNPRAELKSGEVICQLCEEPMIVKAGLIVRPHFAHYAICTSDYKSSPQTPEHYLGKEIIANYLASEYPEAQIEPEYKIEEAKRIADIMAIFPNGWMEAHEIQLASTTSGDLQKRTEDYLNAGVDVVWWLGKNADTETNRNWCLSYFGFCLRIEITEESTKFWDQIQEIQS